MERLDNKKVVIYGDERYSRDFLYVFREITPEYTVDDVKNDFSEAWEKLSGEDKEQVFVIVCKYDEYNAMKNLNRMGYQRNKNYASATTFFKELDFPIKKISDEKRIYVWGTGANGYDFFRQFVEMNPDVEIVGCVDCDVRKQGMTFFGRTVYSPEEIIENDAAAFFVVATKQHYQECRATLIRYGKKERCV